MNTMAGRDWRAWHDRNDELIPGPGAPPRGGGGTARLGGTDPGVRGAPPDQHGSRAT